MRLLLDTNTLVEVILSRPQAEAAKSLLANTKHDMFVSDFSLHSIGVFLFRNNLHRVFELFLNDLLFNLNIGMLSLYPDEMDAIVAIAPQFKLDFDDAYQYSVAERYDLTIVSFDGDFDRTLRGRQTPAQILRSS